jgi:hypothetical protein
MPRWIIRLLTVFAVLCCAATLVAADWTAPANELVRKIVAAGGTGTVNVTVRSPAPAFRAQVPEIERAIEDELRKQNVRAAKNAATEIRVAITENAAESVWIAEIRKPGIEPAVVMIDVPPVIANEPSSSVGFSIKKTLLHAQQMPMLDLLALDVGRTAVLEPDRLAIYRVKDGHWEQDQSFAIQHTRVWPRDLRGRLSLQRDHVLSAYLPGIVCNAANAPIACREADDPWPLGEGQSAFFSATRNFFSGVVVAESGQQTSTQPFYTAAHTRSGGNDVWLFTGTDGKTRAVDTAGARVVDGSANEWGSDIAAVRSGCGTHYQVLATAPGNGEDSVRAYQITNTGIQSVTDALDVPGPVVALWSAPDENSAVAIIRNLVNGMYEAYSLSIACNQ